MRIKIWFVITSLDIGGAQLALKRVLFGMDRQRYQCAVVSLMRAGVVGDMIASLGVPVLSLEMKRGRLPLRGIWHLSRWLRHQRPRIVHTWLYHADLVGTLAARMSRTPALLCWNLRASDLDMTKYGLSSKWTLRACARLSHMPAAVVVNSESGQAFHTRLGYKPSRWVRIENGVDPNQFKPDSAARLEVRRELGLAPDCLLVGLVARYDPMKDHANFLHAATILARREQNVHFVLAGNGVTPDNRALQLFSGCPPLAGRVHLLGERMDIPRLTAALDVASSSSLSEAFPNAVLEAMACGVMCVVTNAGDSARIVGDTGIVVPPGNPEALADAWYRATAMDGAARHRNGEEARHHILQHFTLDREIRQYEALFQELGGEL